MTNIILTGPVIAKEKHVDNRIELVIQARRGDYLKEDAELRFIFSSPITWDLTKHLKLDNQNSLLHFLERKSKISLLIEY